MGHARVDNISRITNHLLHKGGATGKSIIDFMEKHKQKVHASEGDYSERYMLAMMTQQILFTLVDEGAIEPIGMSLAQTQVYIQWVDSQDDKWGEEAHEILDSIQWRAKKKKLPVIKNITN